MTLLRCLSLCRCSRTARFGAVMWACFLGACAGAPDRLFPATDATTKAETTELFAEGTGIPYETTIVGARDIGLEPLMEEASYLIALADQPPASVFALRRRADEDARRLVGVLHSRGFYDGAVTATVDTSVEPHHVTLTVEPGIVYLLGEYDVVFRGPSPPPALVPDLEALGLHIGMAAEADPVVAAQKTLVRRLADAGYPWARALSRTVRLQRALTLMEVEVTLESGRRVVFGPLQVTGTETVEPDFIRRLVPWRQGELYRARRLEDYRRALQETGLFASVDVHVVETEAGSDLAPVRVSVVEAPHRSVGAGVNYSTTEGPGGKVFWEHRNLLGAAERLRMTASASRIEQTLEGDLDKPAFIHPTQSLIMHAEIRRQTSQAYDQLGLGGRVGLERRTPPHWRTGVFGVAELARVEDADGRRASKLVGLPVEMERDTTDNMLDPTHGGRLALVVTPYLGHADKPLLFGMIEGKGSAYYSLDDKGHHVLAGRIRLAGIPGEDRKDLPANKRFYAGGGGSIRGYEYQSVGPLNPEGEPEGGRSVLEMGAEIRLRLVEDIGIVPFLDGGQAYDNIYPNFREDIQWAAGLGLRYFTDIGPVRFDLAFPLNGRPDIDGLFQFYVSLGQAF